jgi:hypothetical protein
MNAQAAPSGVATASWLVGCGLTRHFDTAHPYSAADNTLQTELRIPGAAALCITLNPNTSLGPGAALHLTNRNAEANQGKLPGRLVSKSTILAPWDVLVAGVKSGDKAVTAGEGESVT